MKTFLKESGWNFETLMPYILKIVNTYRDLLILTLPKIKIQGHVSVTLLWQPLLFVQLCSISPAISHQAQHCNLSMFIHDTGRYQQTPWDMTVCTGQTPMPWWIFPSLVLRVLGFGWCYQGIWLKCREVKPWEKIWKYGFTEQKLRNGKSSFAVLSARWCGGWNKSRGRDVMTVIKTFPHSKLFS